MQAGQSLSRRVPRSKVRSPNRKKRGGFLPSAAPTIPTGGKGYSTTESIIHLNVRGNVRYRTHSRQIYGVNSRIKHLEELLTDRFLRADL